MINEEELAKIKEFTGEFLTNMTVEDFELAVAVNPEGAVEVNITLGEPQFLIGQEGKTLFDVQRILRLILNKKLGQIFHVVVDINEYRAKKLSYLKKLARESADQVALTGISKTLPPMTSYERRVVHAELAQRNDVVTKSEGEGLERCVVVAPKNT